MEKIVKQLEDVRANKARLEDAFKRTQASLAEMQQIYQQLIGAEGALQKILDDAKESCEASDAIEREMQ